VIKTKQSIIRSEGVVVDVTDLNGMSVTTSALIGRSNSGQGNNANLLESMRKAQFLPTIGVVGGEHVTNTTTGETYLIVGTQDELIQGQKAAIICYMYVCNATVTISGITEVADKNGNIKRAPIDKLKDVSVYVQQITADMRLYDPGLSPDADYRLYIPVVDIDLMDKVTVSMNGRSTPLKVVSADYLQFNGVVVVQAKTETRK
jgi:hypothetical protein